MSSALSSSSEETMRAISSDCVLAARGAGFGAGAFAFVVLGLALVAFAFFGAAGRAAFLALAFFGADFAPAVLRVRIQILRSAQPECAKLDVFEIRQ
jgi:hypothetical protein